MILNQWRLCLFGCLKRQPVLEAETLKAIGDKGYANASRGA